MAIHRLVVLWNRITTPQEADKDLALANKESLVMAGSLMMRKVEEHGVRLIPVDSEHSALAQCLKGEDRKEVKRLIITASGGPFHSTPSEELNSITPEQALKHPVWNMGDKITIDSATLMNKGLEVIEAHYLFDMEGSRIDAVIHPQSIVHSMVEFVDGSVISHMAEADMTIPLQYALSCPARWPTETRRLDLLHLGDLQFFPPDFDKFPCLGLAYQALEKGGNGPAVLCSANEEAVHAFLERRISFGAIPRLIESAMREFWRRDVGDLEEILRLDREVKSFVGISIGNKMIQEKNGGVH